MQKPNVLIIDDEELCLLSMETMLYGMNLNLKTILGGENGKEYLLTNPKVDLIFLDLMMPKISGLELLSIIKHNPILKDIPVIIQTGVMNETELEKSLALGAKTILTKPYTKDKVLTELSKIFAL